MNELANENQRRGAAGFDGQQPTPEVSDALTQLLQQQIRRWPLASLGTAIVGGYLLGRHETTPAAARNVRMMRATGWMTPGIVQTASTMGVQTSSEHDRGTGAPVVGGQDTIQHSSGSASSPGHRQARDTAVEHQGRVPSQAPNASFASGAGSGATGFDSPPIASSYLSNTDVGGPDQGQPYFPPGGAPDRERSGQEQGGDHP